MKIKMTIATWVDEVLVEAGKEVDLAENQARALIDAGRAVEANAYKAPAKAAKSDE